MKKILLIIAACLAMIFASCSRNQTRTEEMVPIEIGYERFEIRNLQSTDNGTFIYVLYDTATNSEYLYILRSSDTKFGTNYTSSIEYIGTYASDPMVNSAMLDTFERNIMSHTGPLVGVKNG